MTPPAATSAGRQTATHARGHRRRLELQPAPRLPRRVSGPARRGASPKRAPRREPLPARAIATLQSLPDHSVLDRIVRGRAWIPLLGVMLAGIVAMQVELLKLNASIGRSLQLGAALQSRNDILRASVSSLSDAQRIERLASGMGMVISACRPYHRAYQAVAPDPGHWPGLVRKVLELDAQPQDWQAQVAAIQAATMLIVADSDIVRLEHAVEMFHLLGGGIAGDLHGLPRSRLAVVPGTSHTGLCDRAPWVVPAVAAFLDADEPPDG